MHLSRSCHLQLPPTTFLNQQQTPDGTEENPQNAPAHSSILGASDLIDQGWGPGLHTSKKFLGGSDVKPWLRTANLEHFSLKVFTVYSLGIWA